jgi:hypothetical protein
VLIKCSGIQINEGEIYGSVNSYGTDENGKEVLKDNLADRDPVKYQGVIGTKIPEDEA